MVESQDRPSWKYPSLAVAIVLAAWAAFGWFASTRPDPGKFGDMFGAVNALFSGLAFAGLTYAILLQRSELQLQRRELELTREELAGQRQQMQAQNETLTHQRFENTFFQLLRLHNDIVNSIDLRREPEGAVTAQGRDCFKIFFERLEKRWKLGLAEEMDADVRSRINKTYLGFYKDLEPELGHYFRGLYNIVKFVKTSSVVDKRFYTNLVRAQLSSYEVALLFYNCLSDKGSEKFNPMVESFTLLKMVPTEKLFDATHKALFRPSAYVGKT